MADIEKNLWKNNVKSGRKGADFLDTGAEDF